MVARHLDITGQRYGKLLVLRLAAARTSEGKARWECACDCGRHTAVDARNLRSGSTTSCGCYRRDRMGSLHVTHRRSRTPEHGAWRQMRSRCRNPKHANFANYGGRGIRVCPRWDSFELFLADMGMRPSARHSIDRKNNDGNYEPSNCRWATSTQQNQNRRSNTQLSRHGRTMTLTEWAIELGLSVNVLCARLKKGWPVDRALATPLDTTRSHARA